MLKKVRQMMSSKMKKWQEFLTDAFKKLETQKNKVNTFAHFACVLRTTTNLLLLENTLMVIGTMNEMNLQFFLFYFLSTLFFLLSFFDAITILLAILNISCAWKSAKHYFFIATKMIRIKNKSLKLQIKNC